MKSGIVVLLIGTVFVVGCDSKFKESSPSAVNVQGTSLTEKLGEKARMDARMNEVDVKVKKAKKILELFRKAHKASVKEDTYTPLDFFIDANNELRAKMPEDREKRLIRQAQFKVPVKSFTEECKLVETLLESSPLDDESQVPGLNKGFAGERLTYSFKTCGTNSQFLPAIEANWVGNSLEIRLINKNLETILKEMLSTDKNINSSCKFVDGEKAVINSINCKDMKVKLSVSEFAFIRELDYQTKGPTRLHAVGDLFENDVLKAVTEITITSNGSVKLDTKKVSAP